MRTAAQPQHEAEAMSEATTTLRDYLFRTEGSTLEFKGAQALNDPLDRKVIPRAVCGFLNSEGGEIIIGIRETKDGLAVDPIPDPEEARRKILDQIISTIDPVPSVHVDFLTAPKGVALRVIVPKPERQVLHFLKEKRGGFVVYRRLGDRLVPLTRAEIMGPGGPDETARSLDLLRQWQENAERQSSAIRELGGVFLHLRASVPGSLSDDVHKTILEWVQDPTLIGIRRLGWHYSTSEPGTSRPRRAQGAREWFHSGDVSGGFRRLEYSQAGEVRFANRLGDDMYWKSPPARKVLYPYAICEYVSSCVTLFARVTEQAGASGHAHGALTMSGIRGSSLGPHKPGTLGYDHGDWLPPYPADQSKPIVESVPILDLVKSPHGLAWKLVLALYQEFGYDEIHVPFYDRETGRFIFE